MIPHVRSATDDGSAGHVVGVYDGARSGDSVTDLLDLALMLRALWHIVDAAIFTAETRRAKEGAENTER